MKYEMVAGLEIHAQALTESKMFCSCSIKFGSEPNTNICPICTGQPGPLPVANIKAVELGIKAALALNCKIEPSSIFARKNYFYPDLPKGYQISQYDKPLATGGYVDIDVDGVKKRIGITRLHLEEDAGKLVHVGAARIMGAEESLVDYNRGGTPLMEIVSEPDFRSAREAAVYVETLANLLRYIGVCDAKMEEGSLRCDANVSLRPVGQKEFGTKTEVKNMNSFKAVEKALLSEIKRHEEVLSEGGKIVQETRFYSEETNTTSGMRNKEEAHDYRYFPEPDLPPIEPSAEWIEKIRESLGELPQQRHQRLIDQFGLNAETAAILVYDKPLANFFEETTKLYKKGTVVANWLTGEVTAYLKEKKQTIEELNFKPPQLAELLKLIDEGTLSGKLAKGVLVKVIETGKQVKDIVAESGAQISDQGELSKIITDVIAGNAKVVADYKGGKETALTFLVGQVMKLSKGRANPALANKLLKEALK
ncbi:MAG: Asp-tRNA(Asn)/Glu-tRNA(Gln) amidotransferase subunit GatB [Candidatus Margulisiibacteriota bacterium]